MKFILIYFMYIEIIESKQSIKQKKKFQQSAVICPFKGQLAVNCTGRQ